MERNEFVEDITIDRMRLDEEASQQGELFFKWAERSVIAKSKVERLKFQLDVLSAKLSNKIRLDPNTYGIQRVTESAIDTAVKTSAEYKSLYDTWLKARNSLSLLEKAVEAMEQKKRMIEVLVTLHGQEYFSEPSTRKLRSPINPKQIPERAVITRKRNPRKEV